MAKVAKVAKANTSSKGKPAADKPAKKKQPVKAAAPVTPKAAVAGGSAKKVSKKKKKKKPVHMYAPAPLLPRGVTPLPAACCPARAAL